MNEPKPWTRAASVIGGTFIALALTGAALQHGCEHARKADLAAVDAAQARALSSWADCPAYVVTVEARTEADTLAAYNAAMAFADALACSVDIGTPDKPQSP